MHDQDSVPASMNGFFRPADSHVAQRSRRDRLRVQPHAGAAAPAADQFPSDPMSGGGSGGGGVVCDPAMFSSPAAAVLDHFSAQDAGLMIGQSPSGFHDGCSGLTGGRIGGDNSPCYYKGSDQSRYSCDWAMLSCVGGGGGVPLSPPMTSPLGATASHHHQQYYRDLHFPNAHLYNHCHLPEVVTSSSTSTSGNPGLELASVVQPPAGVKGAGHSWADGGSELVLLPSYGGHSSGSAWMSRDAQQQHWGKGGDTGFDAMAGDSRGTQGLSLSLSSTPVAPEFGEAARLATRGSFPGLSSCPLYPKFSVVGDRSYGGSLQCVVSPAAADAHRGGGAGPLGPFTGYATILRSSKFLKPAQLLLDEFCSAVTAGLKTAAKQCDAGERSRGSASVGGRERNSAGVSSSSLPRSRRDVVVAREADDGAGGGARQIRQPDFQQKKAKLLFMQEEVCRRYKQYHQQMQLVFSSFESVAGLSSATPYASLALKAVSKHFRSLKNAISDQLWHISRVLGEEFMSSPSSSRGDMVSTPRSKYIDQNFRKQKVGENSLGFMENNQPVWRPQRGLPERAVAVLRAWLFEHFLHPYPTDTDKHMLATQTGLSRNQVSNWFINARVRLWKPMVEEIHMLETKGMAGMDLNSADRSDAKAASDDGRRPSSSDRQSEAQGNRPYNCSLMEPVFNDESSECLEQWHCEKRSRMDGCGLPAGSGGNLISFAAYPGAMDIGGRGAVSLTLGLHHEGGPGQQQQQQMSYFGNPMVHDFVG